MTPDARPGRWVRVFIVLLLASATAFVVGVAVERNQTHTETANQTPSTNTPHTESGTENGQTHSESGEKANAGEGVPPPAKSSTTETGGETLLGVNPESTAPSSERSWSRYRWPAWRGSVHRDQCCWSAPRSASPPPCSTSERWPASSNENRGGVPALAGLVTALHLAAATAAIAADRTARPTAAPIAATG